VATAGTAQPVRWLQNPRCTLGGMAVLEKYGLTPDPVIEHYKRDVDRTLLREHLKLTPLQRLEKLVAFMRDLDELRHARRRS
jgi:hypothetical protein